MGLAFVSTSISTASAALSGATAQNAIRDALVNHPSGAWTVVEEFDSAGATIHWIVMKNDKTLSGVEFDFYVVIGRNAATGVLTMMVGEVYTLATHSLVTYAPLTGNPVNNILADGTFAAAAGGAPSSFTLGNAFAAGQQNPVSPVNVAAATMRFVTSIEKDVALIMLNGTLWYVGALTDLLVPGPGLLAATPVGCIDLLNGSAGAFGSLTRHPIDAALAPLSVGFSHVLFPVNGTYLALIERLALNTALYLNPDRFQGNRVAASEVAALMHGANVSAGANNTAAKLGALRGKFKYLRMATFPFAAVVYDTIVVDSRKHIIVTDKGSLFNPEFFNPPGYNNAIKYGLVVDTGIAA